MLYSSSATMSGTSNTNLLFWSTFRQRLTQATIHLGHLVSEFSYSSCPSYLFQLERCIICIKGENAIPRSPMKFLYDHVYSFGLFRCVCDLWHQSILATAIDPFWHVFISITSASIHRLEKGKHVKNSPAPLNFRRPLIMDSWESQVS